MSSYAAAVVEDVTVLPYAPSPAERKATSDSEKNPSLIKDVENTSVDGDDSSDDGRVLSDARDLVAHVISIEDDPSLNPWTFRVLVIGIGLSAFGGVLGKQSSSRHCF